MLNTNYSKISAFFKKRVIEIVGILTILLSFFLFLSFFTYTPEDPNFIFSEGTKIQNLFGFYGSFISDLFLQSFGLISFVFCISIFINGILIFKNKEIFNILPSFFYSIIYIFTGSTAITFYNENSFWLVVNGNGGFAGRYIREFYYNFNGFIDEKIILSVLLLLTFIFFLLSIRFNIKYFFKSFSSLFFLFNKLLFRKKTNAEKEENYNYNFENKNDVNNNYKINQPNLPFRENEKNLKIKKFKLPTLEYLSKSIKKNIKSGNTNNNIEPEFLEKILMDFGIEGKIKKISYGPVVTYMNLNRLQE